MTTDKQAKKLIEKIPVGTRFTLNNFRAFLSRNTGTTNYIIDKYVEYYKTYEFIKIDGEEGNEIVTVIGHIGKLKDYGWFALKD